MSIELVIPSNYLMLCLPFLLLPQSFPGSRSFPISRLCIRCQSIGTSASGSVHPMNIQSWFPLGLTGLISLLSNGLSRVFSSTTVEKASILQCSAFFIVQLSHPYMTTGKTIALTIWTIISKVMSLLFNMLSRFVITFLPMSNCLNFMAAVTVHNDFEAQENKVCHCFHCFPIYLPLSDGARCHDLSFSESWVLSQVFHSPLSLSSRGSFVLLCFLP